MGILLDLVSSNASLNLVCSLINSEKLKIALLIFIHVFLRMRWVTYVTHKIVFIVFQMSLFFFFFFSPPLFSACLHLWSMRLRKTKSLTNRWVFSTFPVFLVAFYVVFTINFMGIYVQLKDFLLEWEILQLFWQGPW